MGKTGSALDLAMRVLSCCALGIDYGMDREALLKQQCKDGSWMNGWMYRYGSTGIRIGNLGVTTALAVKAIAVSYESELNGRNGRE